MCIFYCVSFVVTIDWIWWAMLWCVSWDRDCLVCAIRWRCVWVASHNQGWHLLATERFHVRIDRTIRPEVRRNPAIGQHGEFDSVPCRSSVFSLVIFLRVSALFVCRTEVRSVWSRQHNSVSSFVSPVWRGTFRFRRAIDRQRCQCNEGRPAMGCHRVLCMKEDQFNFRQKLRRRQPPNN